MSYRHTFITNFLYKYGQTKDLKKIAEVLNKYSSNIHWQGQRQMGYFHGTIKDLDGSQTELEESEIIKSLKEVGVEIKIVYEP